MAQDTAFCEKKIEDLFSSGAKPLVMGILNVTPDSFFDGGKYTVEHQWLVRAEEMVEEGVDIIDIGAYSTRPGAENISVKEEIGRLLHPIVSIKNRFPEVLISADTFRAQVAEGAIESGAHIINDVSGGTMDNEMFEIIAKYKVPYVLMHIQGTPQTMQLQPSYKDVVEEVYCFFKKTLAELNAKGIQKIIVDPGFGFGKTIAHNYELIEQLEKFNEFQLPVLTGFSRKSMITKLLNIKSDAALNGTTVLNTVALLKGSKILRVHDVKEAKEAIQIINQFDRTPELG